MAFDFPSSPTTGQTYSVTGGPTYVYNGTAWVVLTPGNQFNRTVFTATAGQTTFTMNYVVGAIDVYRNGVKLAPADFTATNGTSIVLLNAATVGDTIEVISYPMITYSDAVRRTGDTMTGALALPSGGLNVGSGQLSVDTSGRILSTSQPGFLATGISSASGVQNPLIFTTTSHNQGNVYNTSNGRFTAPITGRYFVSYKVRIDNTTGYFHPIIAVNGVDQSYTQMIWGGTLDYKSLTWSGVIALSANDYVTVNTQQNQNTAGAIAPGNQQSFSAYLLG